MKSNLAEGNMDYHRLVVKFGTSLLTGGSGRLNLEMMSSLVGQVAQLHSQGREVLVVTSGAISAGRQKLGLSQDSPDIPFKQVLAAVGQSRLMNAYEQLFGWHDIVVAQALLTRADLSDRSGYLNARNTLLSLLELRVVPIINENDVVAVEEIEGATFGDNDTLSAMVASLVDADMLILLTDIPGLFTGDPRLDASARLIPRVERIDNEIERMAGGSAGGLGIGGMSTKIQAARLATASGTAMVIADGREQEVLPRLAAGEAIGTFFSPTASRVESRRRRLLAARARGRIVLDSGAVIALCQQNRSLLPVGITAVEGEFRRGEIVNMVDEAGRRLACGIASYSSAEINLIKGHHSERIAATLGYEYGAEVVHRNNMVLL